MVSWYLEPMKINQMKFLFFNQTPPMRTCAYLIIQGMMICFDLREKSTQRNRVIWKNCWALCTMKRKAAFEKRKWWNLSGSNEETLSDIYWEIIGQAIPYEIIGPNKFVHFMVCYGRMQIQMNTMMLLLQWCPIHEYKCIKTYKKRRKINLIMILSNPMYKSPTRMNNI